MANKARHAFGNSSDVETAIQAGKIDAYDILFLDGDTEPKVGWLDKDGEFRLVKNETDLSGVEAEIAKKANAEDVETLESQLAEKASMESVAALEDQIIAKADATDVAALEAEIATKVNAETVEFMIKEATVGVIEVVEF